MAEQLKDILLLTCVNSVVVFAVSSCLRSWLEQDATCPTCRTSIGESPLTAAGREAAPPQPGPVGDETQQAAAAPGQQEQQLRNHFFHFDGELFVLRG